jgi:hypothetical protein
MSMIFDTKIAVVVRNDLATWQKLNITAFTISGVAGTVENIMGENYIDGSGNVYLPMIIQPILIYEADGDDMRKIYERALRREVRFSVYTEELFSTGNDIDNRAAVRARKSDELQLVGMAMRADRKTIDKIFKGIALHR